MCIHTLKPGAPNDYVDALKGYYNAYQSISKFMVAYGFGAKTVPKKGESRTCDLFSCTGNFADPYVNSQQELLNSYVGTIKTVELSLPVQFRSIVKFVCDLAMTELGTVEDPTEICNYFVLTLFMAGVIDDF